jgi:hypothetical protein
MIPEIPPFFRTTTEVSSPAPAPSIEPTIGLTAIAPAAK